MRLRLDRRRRELNDGRAAITEAAISGAIAPETSREQLDRNRVEDESLAHKQAELGRLLPDLEKLAFSRLRAWERAK